MISSWFLPPVCVSFNLWFNFCRLALKAFTEQKRRFFPGLAAATNETKRPRVEASESAETVGPSLPDLLRRLQPETQGMAVTPYDRLAWVNKSKSKDGMGSRVLSSNSSLAVRHGNAGAPQAGGDNPASSTRQQAEKQAVLEASIPGVLVAVISVLPANSVYPDAIALFSPTEVGHRILE